MTPAGILCKFINVAFNANFQRSYSLLHQNLRCVSNQRLSHIERNVSVNCVAYTHGTQAVKPKFFPDIENERMHSAMENMPRYEDLSPYPTLKSYTSIALQHWGYSPSKQPTDVVQKFVAVTLENAESKLDIDDSRFRDVINAVVCHMPRATDDQLFKILVSLCLWRGEARERVECMLPMFKKVWNSLDRECAKRVRNWAPSFKLLVADYWFHLRLARITKYNSLMIKDLIESKDVLSVPQLVQLMFYVNLQRDTPQSLLKLLEDKLGHVIEDINIQELGIICLGFFKTRNRVVSKKIVKSVILRLMSEVSKGDSFAVSGCLKFLRRSMHGDLKDLYISLLNQCTKDIPKFDVPCVIHLTLLSYGINKYMPSVLDAAIDRIVEIKSTMRAKDGMKLLHCLAHFNHQLKPDFDRCIRNALESEEYKQEIADFPRVLIYALLSYAYLGIYPINLIETALHPEFVQRCIDLNGVEMMNPISVLNYCVEIECDNYHGPKLDRSFLKVLSNEKGNLPEERGHQTFRVRLTSLTLRLLSEICDSKDVCVKHVLPHMYSPDIIVRLNSKDELPLSSVLNPLESCVIKPPPDETWVCVMLCGGYCYAYNSKHMTGLNVMKHRQLLKLGYKVLLVPQHEAETTLGLKNYLKQNFDLLKKNDFSNLGKQAL